MDSSVGSDTAVVLDTVVLDTEATARLARDCRRVAEAIDEQVALLRSGAYGGVRTRGPGGYRPAVEAVVTRLAQRADELRSAARGLTAQSRVIADADRCAAQRIIDLGPLRAVR